MENMSWPGISLLRFVLLVSALPFPVGILSLVFTPV
jgi:hypothetical protein